MSDEIASNESNELAETRREEAWAHLNEFLLKLNPGLTITSDMLVESGVHLDGEGKLAMPTSDLEGAMVVAVAKLEMRILAIEKALASK
ncbi:hypothetical protein GCM10027413_07370 [Conyzicola nivalis]|uniref:Uncharacterized protein n=1 Tax=Conyzicola nivalis TaxID=1477021 RepID=A0A916WJZ3_9MICO|nr:hypothetical protein [Conyzicola nivalis]GGB04701.1 hypothetical protein GCM10010979_19260 [Conyzicola nivalis]